jgi:uncharacterized Fe-S cluster-containing radical SAM superfamily protein
MHSKLNTETLILVVTSRCNLSCDYCQILKENRDMEFETAWRAVSLFLGGKNVSENRLIKFFGGEPLLNFCLINKVIDKVNKNYKNIEFKLPSNGTLLGKETLSFIKNNPNIDLVISSRNIKLLNKNELIKKITELPLVTVSINLFPEGLQKNVDQFRKLLKTGFSRFNFLPAYFIYWTPQDIKMLRKVLKKIAKIIQLSPQKIHIANIDVFSDVPLFNLVPAVDQEGDIYAGNFFLDKRFDNWKTELKLGNIRSAGNWCGIYDLYFDFGFLINKIFSNDILSSTDAVDRELSRFVDNF